MSRWSRKKNTIVYQFILNRIYTDGKYFYKFIKVTPKGFNLLNTATGKCALYPHLYDKKFLGNGEPLTGTVFEIELNAFFTVERCIFLSSLVPKERLEEVRRA